VIDIFVNSRFFVSLRIYVLFFSPDDLLPQTLVLSVLASLFFFLCFFTGEGRFAYFSANQIYETSTLLVLFLI
jgi:hypothetical protein